MKIIFLQDQSQNQVTVMRREKIMRRGKKKKKSQAQKMRRTSTVMMIWHTQRRKSKVFKNIMENNG